MHELVPIAALATLALFVVYILTLAVAEVARGVRATRAQNLERDLLMARIGRLATPTLRADAQSNGLAWSGIRKFVLAGKVLEAEDTCSFYFAPHDGQPLPLYLPGQYLTFQLPIPGQPRPVTRCYSLSDSPTHPDYFRVTVKRQRAGGSDTLGADGLVSTYLHRQLGVGDLVNVKAPAGHFHLDPDDPAPLVLIGGGVGITPLLSMLSYITSVGSRREVWLFYGVRDGCQHVMREYLRSTAAEHDNVHLHVCYSQPREEDQAETDYQHAERISVDLLKRLLPSSNYHFYVCGPAGMMDIITHDLATWGVPKSHIHFEAFGAATVKRVGKGAEVTPSQRFTIEFARSGRSCDWDGSFASLLEFAEINGISMESGCRAGNCGACLTAIRAGDIEYLNDPGSSVEEGSCLTCISVPRGNLVLDA